jgi:hypothetical protein
LRSILLDMSALSLSKIFLQPGLGKSLPET